MLAYGNYFPACALAKESIRLRLPLLMHYDSLWLGRVLEEAKQSAKFTGLLGVSGYKMLSPPAVFKSL